MDHQDIIHIFVDFVAGKLNFEDFKNYLAAYPQALSLLEDQKPNQNFPYQRGKTIKDCLYHYRWDTAAGRLNVHKYIIRYLDFYQIPNQPTPYYHNDWAFRIDIQPNYVDIEDDALLDQILKSTPTGLSKTQKKKWLKTHIKSLFKYETKPPKWIQAPEWPIMGGIPLVFKFQTKESISQECIHYHFYHPLTLQAVVIEQFY